MRFKTRPEAAQWKRCHPLERARIIRASYWSMEEWGWKPCWTVVLQ